MKQHAGKPLITLLMIAGILIAYVHQMSPSPFLSILREHFQITGSEALLNLSVSIIYPFLIVASLIGSLIEQRTGTRRLFVLTLAFLATGIFANYTAVSYTIFLLGRVAFGIGFGLGIPFIGSAIMKLYHGKGREAMNTLNALFPFLGTLISFALLIPLYHAMGNSWKNALGIWGVGILAIGFLWLLFAREWHFDGGCPEETSTIAAEKHIYLNLWKRKEIRLLTIIFMCDYFCYSYIAVILPTFLMEIGSMSEAAAGLWAALTFPGVGIAGCLLGGMVSARSGRRKPVLVAGVLLEVIGVLLSTLGAGISLAFVIIGISLFALGNGLWLPVMYNIPMDLKGMNPVRVGASFAFISSCGFACGFLSPMVGGWLTNALMPLSPDPSAIASHALGLQWSLFLFGFVNLAAFICALAIRETGQAAE